MQAVEGLPLAGRNEARWRIGDQRAVAGMDLVGAGRGEAAGERSAGRGAHAEEQLAAVGGEFGHDGFPDLSVIGLSRSRWRR